MGRDIIAYISIILLLLTDSVYLFLQSGLTHQEKEKFGHLSRWFDNVSVSLFNWFRVEQTLPELPESIGGPISCFNAQFLFCFPFPDSVTRGRPTAPTKSLLYQELNLCGRAMLVVPMGDFWGY